MKYIFLFILVMTMPFVFSATPFSPSLGSHPVQQITTDQTGMTSIDANADGIIDVAERVGSLSGSMTLGDGQSNAVLRINGSAAQYSAIDFYSAGTTPLWGLGRNAADNKFYLDRTGIGRALTVDPTSLNLGVGTSTPSHKLDVAGNVALSGNLYLASGSRVALNGAAIGSGGGYGIGNGAAYSNVNSIAVDTLETDGGTGGSGVLELNYYGGSRVDIGSGASKELRTGVLSFGGVGGNSNQGLQAYAIYQEGGGWSYPYPDLRIAYHTGIKLGAHSSYNGIRFYNDYDMSGLVMAVNDYATSGANNVYIPYTLYVGSSLYSPAFYYSSDESLKKNIKTIPHALDNIQKLRGVQFNWKNSSEPGMGLIAQEVEQVYPDMVHLDPQTNLKSVEYGNLIAPLIEAVKEQQSMIEEQQLEIDALKKEIEDLKG